MSIFAGVPLLLWGFTFSGCLQALIKRSFGTKFMCVVLHVWVCVCVCVCVWACLCLSVPRLPRLKAVVVKPIHYASLYTETGLFSLPVLREGNTFIAACVNPLSVIAKQDVFAAPTLTFESRRVVILELSPALFPVSLALSLLLKMSCHRLSLPFPVVVVFSCFAGPTAGVSMLSTPVSSTTSWKSASCQDDFIMSQSVLCLILSSHSFHHALRCCKSTQPV